MRRPKLAAALVLGLLAALPAALPGLAAEAPAPGDALTLPAGSVLRPLATAVAPQIVTLEEATRVEVVERHGGWLRVRWGEITGWVDPAAEPAAPPADAPPLGAPPLAAAAASPSQDDLDAARAALGAGARHLRAGPFVLLTDVQGPLPDQLDRLAGEAIDAYAARYGLPVPAADGAALAGALVLFAREADFRAFADRLGEDGERPSHADLAGQTRGRLAAFQAGDRSREQVSRLLLHELVHLLNRQSLRTAGDRGDPLPPWLDEGLAGDLEMFTLGADGRLGRSDPARADVERHGRPRPYGPWLALPGLVRDAELGRLESAGELLALDRDAFLDRRRGTARYALAAFWVRYLLSGEGGELAPPFRAWLAGRAAGDEAGGEALLARLGEETGRDRERLDAGFQRWLTDLALRLGLAPSRR